MNGTAPEGSVVSGAFQKPDATDRELLERFLRYRDEAAFTPLLRRHGPMVLGLCRRLLHHTQDAEDAFQATFLVFVRKAASIGKREQLGSWLYGVALRVASRARLLAARRQQRERLDMERVATAAAESAVVQEDFGAVTEEVGRLPVKYRGPVLLCYLEGRTNEEAAQELGWPVGTVKGRLARAREMLRKRLLRRGLDLSPTAFTAALSGAALAALPTGLIDSTTRAATQLTLEQAVAGGLVSTQTAALTKGVLHTMFVTKTKSLAGLLLSLTLVLGGLGVLSYDLLATGAGPRKADQESIQGRWEIVSFKVKGKEQDNLEALKKEQWEFTADKLILKSQGGNREATYKLDPTARPKTMDITSRTEGAQKGEVIPSLYALEGDKLTICSPVPGNSERPKALESKEDSETTLILLKRVKK